MTTLNQPRAAPVAAAAPPGLLRCVSPCCGSLGKVSSGKRRYISRDVGHLRRGQPDDDRLHQHGLRAIARPRFEVIELADQVAWLHVQCDY
jgi:hypothetical protein